MGETIFALASGRGRAGVAVLRLSGPRAGGAVAALAGGLPAPRLARLAALRDPGDGTVIDRALVLWFPAPASFTGEDVAEFHVHGGRAILNRLTVILGALGLRPAGPGEFTRRAFENGKLDLSQAEAIADLVDAETEAQRRQALRQLDGAMGRLYEAWRDRLKVLLARLEALIDFPDEGLDEAIEGEVLAGTARLRDELARHLADGHRGERLRDGFEIAITGAPNVGKSSLLNRLAAAEVAIVSEIPGTTRDVIEVALDLGGYRVVLIDTAGLRETDDPIEREGVRRARQRAATADLRLHVVGPGDPAPGLKAGPETITVANKADLGPGPADAVPVSARTGAGIDRLLALITARVAERLEPGEAPAITRARHRLAVEEAVAALERALSPLPLPAELRAEDLRLALRALGRVVGAVDVEDLLDVIFFEFCIGK
ncbi:tRNA uridine-5-carboxymethylaminomethyl(34) synthesis GTPase MnmE [Zavarzinia compransoris]|uniref:tRNA modification GTPase MnmE n=1 Tax=Zavarzinia compransoris TaxID=1264899 RepID=A0A317E5N4_9PROT|nr:tRNA uridine-5-carboxymethylaminomethyl(34) synthesis GTPase MnmE [Zavarzinia compransoris]PWR20653.1 tRNA uridine-5-carboxymethylaminomethyl(34) synthesis GTPase MnmE [Zavarzinia compransoris]TDP44527.1 tRNA modification GTPase trmE [Zavarzinia compransoris]